MDCKTYKKMIPLYLDNELSSQEAEMMDTHIKACVSCKSEVETLHQMLIMLDSWKGIDPTFSCADIKAIAKTRCAQGRLSPCLLMPFHIPKWAAACGVAACIFIGILTGLNIEARIQPLHDSETGIRLSSYILSLDTNNDPLAEGMPWEKPINPFQEEQK